MVKLIIETQESETKRDFNYNTDQWEESETGIQNYFTIVADTKEEAEKLFDEIDKLFVTLDAPERVKNHSDYDNKYTIISETKKKIDKRKLKKYL